MEKKYRILILCATSIATSTAIAEKLKEAFRDSGLNVEITQGKGADYIPQAATLHEKFDLVISTVDFPKDVKVNVVNGVPFITGIGEQEVIKKIFEILEQKGGND